MVKTIFYSWQSDTPSNNNRAFIKNSIERAIKCIAHDISIEEVTRGETFRLDQDTLGIPGQPEIFNTVLQKIEICEIFVSDLTFVTHTEKGKGVPNPNVMLELGYAMQSIGSSRIIFVMNEAFGKAKDGLPFDLAHLRWPILYTLNDATSPETKRQVREDFVSELVFAIRLIIENEEDISFRAYKRKALSELTLIPYRWRDRYRALCPEVLNYPRDSGGDIWDAFINAPRHEYSEDEWKKFVPLFYECINIIRDQLERFMILHSSVLPASLKVAIIDTIGNLEMEQTVYMYMPHVNGKYGDGDVLGFDMRFKEVARILSSFIRKVESARRPSENSI